MVLLGICFDDDIFVSRSFPECQMERPTFMLKNLMKTSLELGNSIGNPVGFFYSNLLEMNH